MRPIVLFATLTLTLTASAQWDIQDSGTKASLRGIHSLGKGVAWASGSDGTVLRTEDGGHHWQHCAIPPGAEKLDFRGVQGFDEKTAIVMSSGKGDLSRLYKTTDGCQTWKLVFTNPDKDGFWDGIHFATVDGAKAAHIGYVVGDPVDGYFPEFVTYDYGDHWEATDAHSLWISKAKPDEALFAASNSSMLVIRNSVVFVTGGAFSRMRMLEIHSKHDPQIYLEFVGGTLPFPRASSAGAFSFAAKLGDDSVGNSDAANFIEKPLHQGDLLISVGGDYLKPNDLKATASFSLDGGLSWRGPSIPPNGYRSAVAYDEKSKTWITVGPNGTDISTDDGRNWRALKPGPNDAPDAEKDWNALSLPFVVGSHGRIGLLRPSAIAAKP